MFGNVAATYNFRVLGTGYFSSTLTGAIAIVAQTRLTTPSICTLTAGATLDIFAQSTTSPYIRFGVGNNNTTFTTEWARFNGTGFGIGIVPTHKLDVNGDINIATGSHYKINGTNLTYSDVGAAATSHTLEGHTATVSTGQLLVGTGTNTFGWFNIGTSLQQLRTNTAGTGIEWFTPSSSGGTSKLASFYTDASTSGINYTTMYSYTIPIDTLHTNGDFIEGEFVYDFGNTMTDLLVRLTIAGTNYDFGGTSTIYGNQLLKFRIYRVSNTEVRINYNGWDTSAFTVPSNITGLNLTTTTYDIVFQLAAKSGTAYARNGYINLIK